MDYYPQKSIAELIVMLEAVQARQSDGSITEVATAGTRVVKDFTGQTSAGAIEDQIIRIRYSLFLKDSAQLAAGESEILVWKNPHTEKIRTTRPSYL